MFRKAFTLVELMIVLIIIWLIVASGIKDIFSYKNINRLKFDTCYIHIYSKIDNFFQNAVTQKWVYTWSKYESPLFYNILFDKNTQTLAFEYSWLIVNKLYLNGTWMDTKNECYAPWYHTFFSWYVTKIKIKAWLQVDTSLSSVSPVQIYSGDVLLPPYKTGTVYFYYCPNKSNLNCLQKYKITIDPRAYIIKSYFCKTIWANWNCVKWSE